MQESKQLLFVVQAFFQEYLASHRALSPNTILAYRDTIKLFLHFVAGRRNTTPSKLRLVDLQPDAVLAFLEDLEVTRNNAAVTRNLRLAALRTFSHYLVSEDIVHAGQYQKIIAIPLKRATRPLMGYLEPTEIKAILEAIDRQQPSGRRDYALLAFLHNTGARVQEVIDLKVSSLRTAPPPLVTLNGKGGKTRQVPLWPETLTLLNEHLSERGVQQQPQAWLFVNARGQPFTRFGIRHLLRTRVAAAIARCPTLREKRISPHTFRHSTAMHFLQAGVDLTVIKSWLGHVHLATTHAYLEIDLEMKRKALSACAPMGSPETLQRFLAQNQDIIQWLESL